MARESVALQGRGRFKGERGTTGVCVRACVLPDAARGQQEGPNAEAGAGLIPGDGRIPIKEKVEDMRRQVRNSHKGYDPDEFKVPRRGACRPRTGGAE